MNRIKLAIRKPEFWVALTSLLVTLGIGTVAFYEQLRPVLEAVAHSLGWW